MPFQPLHLFLELRVPQSREADNDDVLVEDEQSATPAQGALARRYGVEIDDRHARQSRRIEQAHASVDGGEIDTAPVDGAVVGGLDGDVEASPPILEANGIFVFAPGHPEGPVD